jgi:uncharacterized protein with HEPN domain
VLEAVEAIRSHVGRGLLDDPLIFDAVRMRLVEIGAAVGAIPDELLATEPRATCTPRRTHLRVRWIEPEGSEGVDMRTWQTVLGIVVVIAVLYVAFIVGAVFVRIMMGLIALLIIAWLIRAFVIRPGGRSGP